MAADAYAIFLMPASLMLYAAFDYACRYASCRFSLARAAMMIDAAADAAA